jgi:TonB family protein
LFKLIRNSSSYLWKDKYRIVEVNQVFPTFSFFNHIFIGDASQYSEAEKEQIITHETVHVDKLHSIDVLFIEMIRIAFWFNPFVHSYKKIITNLHEFQADEKATEEHEVNQYCSLLARVALMSADFKLANHFNNSLTLNRIKMMKATKIKMRRWKLAFIIPVIAGFFFIVSCEDQVITDIAKNSTNALVVPENVQERFEQLKHENPNSNYILVELNEEAQLKLAEMEKMHGLPKSIEVFKIGEENYESTGNASIRGEASEIHIRKTDKRSDDSQTFAIIEYNEAAQAISDKIKQEGEIFLVVEESAHPVGGVPALTEYLKENMRYPEVARKNGISGKIFVEFVINKDGSLSDVKVLKSLSKECDEEAIRVLANSPNWIPAKQRGKEVRQKMVLPIIFSSTSSQVDSEPVKQSSLNMKLDIQSKQENGVKYVTGYVKDEAGNPLLGANVVVAGTTQGTVVDQDGKFSISFSEGNKLVVSFVGYETREYSF